MRVTLVVLVSVAAAAVPAVASAASAPVRVFLERNGQTVTAHSGDEVAIPRFGGGDRAWTQLVACVKERFTPFQVEISDRPMRGDHITALVGGKASMLGLSDRTTNGIGPYSGEVIPNATVHVFSQVGTGERDVDNLCAVTAHEIGHSLGLDHSNVCGDLMSYHNDECGTQQFLDVDGPCGELSDRDCSNGDATQNSYQRLAALVGLRDEAPRTGPKARTAAPATEDIEDIEDIEDDATEPDDAIDDADAGDVDAGMEWTDESADETAADDTATGDEGADASDEEAPPPLDEREDARERPHCGE